MINTVKKYGSNDFLGTRDPIRNVYSYKTYEEIYNIALNIGSGIMNLNLAPEI